MNISINYKRQDGNVENFLEKPFRKVPSFRTNFPQFKFVIAEVRFQITHIFQGMTMLWNNYNNIIIGTYLP